VTKYLKEYLILPELLTDNLSNVPEDIFNEGDCGDSGGEIIILRRVQSESESSKWPKKVAMLLINCALFISFQLYKKLNPATKMRYEEFLLQVAKDWAADKMEAVEQESATDSGRLSGDMQKHVL
jgi:ABC-type transporter Mla maintaining outer membrane lipid asymmetry ATPase subunit MlaF